MKYLETAQPLYILPREPFVDEVLIPAFKSAAKVDCMVGFFSSTVLSHIAPGLATFITESDGIFRLIISPYLQPNDINAIKDGVEAATSIATDSMEKLLVTENLIEQHTLNCLSYLLSIGRLEIKIALMKDALFHPKVWLFYFGEATLAAHGSSNVTQSGISKNKEQIAICKSWIDRNQDFTVQKLTQEFTSLWKNEETDCIVIPVPEAIKMNLLKTYQTNIPPSEDDLRELFTQVESKQSEMQPTAIDDISIGGVFSIPSDLHFEEGEFAHQGKAVEAWHKAGSRGILEMATGSGKTITSMIAAHRLYETKHPLLIVVAAPYIPLVDQWFEEIIPFGLIPTNLTRFNGAKKRGSKLEQIKRRLRTKFSSVEVVIVSHDTLCTSDFKNMLDSFNCSRLLIADEVHNLGSVGFINDPPEFFEYRLGLSATPERQFDDDGTDALFSFFGEPVFKFTMEEAIGLCLVEYDYFTHAVELSEEEMEEWFTLSEQIKKNSWKVNEAGKPSEMLSSLYRKRRELLETAEGKISALDKLLDSESHHELKHTLIYATDKQPEQLQRVNKLLRSKKIGFHQLTADETRDRSRTATIIKAFQEGKQCQVLTAKRVLDEGVNIPQICKAYVLASTTVERQWIQRRGRLLRNCKDINKKHSVIHDFIVLPPDNYGAVDQDYRTLAKAELRRVTEFSRLARNSGSKEASLDMIGNLTRLANM